MIDAAAEFRRLREPSLLKPNRLINEGLQLYCLCLLVLAVWYGFAWQWWLLAYVMHCLFYGVGSAIGSHRYWSHKSFVAPRWFQWVMLFFNTVGHSSAIFFTVAHLQHHRYADTEKDPHAPARLGWRAFFMWRLDPLVDTSGVMRFRNQPLVMWCHNRKNLILFFYAGALFMIDPRLFVFCWAIPYVTGTIATGTEAYHVHKYGYQNFAAGSSGNVWWLWPLTLGENWHNNHHHEPRAASTKVKWWEIDPCGWLIEAVRQ